MWIVRSILPEFLANSFLFGVLMLFVSVFCVGVLIEGIKYHEGIGENFIVAGRVTVDGKIINTLGARADAAVNKICVDGKELKFDAEKIYLLLNKPEGFLSAASDKRGRATVLDLVKEVGARVYPCGRLDLNSSGLILMTNDGELMNRLLHPRFKISKT